MKLEVARYAVGFSSNWHGVEVIVECDGMIIDDMCSQHEFSEDAHIAFDRLVWQLQMLECQRVKEQKD